MAVPRAFISFITTKQKKDYSQDKQKIREHLFLFKTGLQNHRYHKVNGKHRLKKK